MTHIGTTQFHTKDLEYFRLTKLHILDALKSIRSRGFFVVPKVRDTEAMLRMIYNKPRKLITTSRGIVYYTDSDERTFWEYGWFSISYSQVCYSSGQWSDDLEIVAEEICHVMKSYGLVTEWNGDPHRKVLIDLVTH